jgi:hypothetical protein
MGYSNSSLVSYTQLSPNYESRNGKQIKYILPHCMAGNCSVETCGNIFSNPEREASSNYGIGSDGRIALYVPECYRAWCTGGTKAPKGIYGSSLDYQGVSIEIANDGGEPDWHISDEAFESLVDLCEDICMRNDIPKLLWEADPDLVDDVDRQNIAVHRWFAYKACPGDYIFNKIGELADRVNERLAGGYSEDTSAESTDNSSNDPAIIIWDFLTDKGLNAYATAGLMANIYAESGLMAANLQNSYESILGYSDSEYTAAVDNGSYDNFVHDSAGYGLCQWTYWSRKQALLDYANETGRSIGDINMQLEYLWNELQGYSNVIDVLNSASSVREASDVVLTDFERPANQSDEVKEKRASYGNLYYDRFANDKSPLTGGGDAELVTEFPSTPFAVKVIIDDLNFRTEPSMEGIVKGQTSKGIFTITEVSNGWGKLKSGVGWIYLENASYVVVLDSIATSPEPEEEVSQFPYAVKVDITDLNIRRGPGTNYGINGQTGVGVFTIIDESDGEGASKWLKLKSGAGWISDDFVTRLD